MKIKPLNTQQELARIQAESDAQMRRIMNSEAAQKIASSALNVLDQNRYTSNTLPCESYEEVQRYQNVVNIIRDALMHASQDKSINETDEFVKKYIKKSSVILNFWDTSSLTEKSRYVQEINTHYISDEEIVENILNGKYSDELSRSR